MKQTQRPRTIAAPSPVTASLRLSGPSERLRAAAQEHEKLLQRVARKRSALDHLQITVRTTMTAVASRMAPLMEEGRLLDEKIHALFDALLAARQSRRARSQIRRIYLDLQESGAISWRDELDEAWPDGVAQMEDATFGSAHDGGFPPTPSATRPNDRDALRALYRRLVEALHPDKVQDEGDRARRTEVMKDITVAYRENDFARLVEIERTWATTAAPVTTDDQGDLERRHGALSVAIGELKRQLRDIEQKLRLLRRSPEGKLANDFGRNGASGRDAAVAGIAEGATVDLQRLRDLHDFVGMFRDGKMSLAEFLEGPETGAGIDDALDDDELDMDELLGDFLSFLQKEAAVTAPRKGSARGKRSRRKAARSRTGV